MTLDQICTQIENTPLSPHRRLIAVCGPPASGKSTFADTLAHTLIGRGHAVTVVPMDGFHLDNRLLEQDGTLMRKGAPHTFDAHGALRVMSALQHPQDVVFPLFDRSREIAIAGAGRVKANCETVVIEGNYLLHDADIWRDLAPLWSLSIALTPARAVLRQRLVERWLAYGFSQTDAEMRANENDMKNAELVLRNLLPADLRLKETPQ